MGAIRLFLAFGVVILHLNEQVLDPRGLHAESTWVANLTGGRAVIFFYIVSGFLISYVLNNKYPQSAAGTLAFYRSRLLRIYPLWWVLLFFCVAIGPLPWTARAAAQLGPASLLIGSDWIVALWRYPAPYWSLFPLGCVSWRLALVKGSACRSFFTG